MKRKVMHGVAVMLILAGLVFTVGCGGSSSTTASSSGSSSGGTVSGNAK